MMKYLTKVEEKKFSVKSFSPELIELINEVYHMDFLTFGYEKIKTT